MVIPSFKLSFLFWVDVYSFGMAMWEIITGEEPYANMHRGAIIGTIRTCSFKLFQTFLDRFYHQIFSRDSMLELILCPLNKYSCIFIK